MKISVEIANRTKKRINPDLVKNIILKTVKISGIPISAFSLSVAFVGKKDIQALNKTYRKKDRATDVLSFSYDLGYNKKKMAGELVLCPEIIAEQAKENKVIFQKELVFVLSHGVLHILGMKHGKKMYDLQDEIISKIKNQKITMRNAKIF